MKIGNNFKLSTNEKLVKVIKVKTVKQREHVPAPQYLQNITFPYKPFNETEKKRFRLLIKAYREQRKKQLAEYGSLLKSLMDGMLENLGYIDYPKLVKEYQHEKSIYGNPHNDNEKKVEIYYTQIADLSVSADGINLIGVQPITGKLEPLHSKIDEMLGYTDFELDDDTNKTVKYVNME